MFLGGGLGNGKKGLRVDSLTLYYYSSCYQRNSTVWLVPFVELWTWRMLCPFAEILHQMAMIKSFFFFFTKFVPKTEPSELKPFAKCRAKPPVRSRSQLFEARPRFAGTTRSWSKLKGEKSVLMLNKGLIKSAVFIDLQSIFSGMMPARKVRWEKDESAIWNISPNSRPERQLLIWGISSWKHEWTAASIII